MSVNVRSTARRIPAFLVIAGAGVATTIAGTASASAAPAGARSSDANIDVCHATGAENHWVAQTIDGSAAYNRVQNQDNDIIGPFTYDGASYSLNWNETNAAILDNGCIAPGTVVTPPAPPSGDTNTGGDTGTGGDSTGGDTGTGGDSTSTPPSDDTNTGGDTGTGGDSTSTPPSDDTNTGGDAGTGGDSTSTPPSDDSSDGSTDGSTTGGTDTPIDSGNGDLGEGVDVVVDPPVADANGTGDPADTGSNDGNTSGGTESQPESTGTGTNTTGSTNTDTPSTDATDTPSTDATDTGVVINPPAPPAVQKPAAHKPAPHVSAAQTESATDAPLVRSALPLPLAAPASAEGTLASTGSGARDLAGAALLIVALGAGTVVYTRRSNA